MSLPATLQESIKTFARAARSENTRKAYASDCRIFAAWCGARGFEAFPCAPQTVAAFVADQAQQGTIAISTLARRLAAIRRVHMVKGWPNPINDTVAEVLSGARRTAGQTTQPSHPLVIEDIRTMIDHIEQGSLVGARDRALILIGFAGALRRSEIRAMRFEHLEQAAGGLVLTIPRSKTDQDGTGQAIALLRGVSASLCPVSALHDWTSRAGIMGGPVFRAVDERRKEHPVSDEALSDYGIACIIKRRARLAGLDSTKVSAHSLRSGALTSGALAGASTWKLRELSRHKSLSSLGRYVRPVEMFQDHALAKVL